MRFLPSLTWLAVGLIASLVFAGLDYESTQELVELFLVGAAVSVVIAFLIYVTRRPFEIIGDSEALKASPERYWRRATLSAGGSMALLGILGLVTGEILLIVGGVGIAAVMFTEAYLYRKAATSNMTTDNDANQQEK